MSGNTKELKALLIKLGFGSKEVEVFLAIQKYSKITPAELAQVTNINRTTIYSISKELIKRGVVLEDLGGKQRFLIASQPESLAGVLRREQKELDSKKEIVNQAMNILKEFAKDAEYAVPKIQFITEDKLEDFLYTRTPEWDRSIMETDGTYLGFQEQAFVEHYAAWIKWYWSRYPKGMRFNLLSSDSEAEQRVASFTTTERKITFWKKNLKFTATTWVMGDYVVMFVLSSSPHYLVEIHDARFAQNQRALFKAILEDVDAQRS